MLGGRGGRKGRGLRGRRWGPAPGEPSAGCRPAGAVQAQPVPREGLGHRAVTRSLPQARGSGARPSHRGHGDGRGASSCLFPRSPSGRFNAAPPSDGSGLRGSGGRLRCGPRAGRASAGPGSSPPARFLQDLPARSFLPSQAIHSFVLSSFIHSFIVNFTGEFSPTDGLSFPHPTALGSFCGVLCPARGPPLG